VELEVVLLEGHWRVAEVELAQALDEGMLLVEHRAATPAHALEVLGLHGL
jgi:hypothetical protein